MTVKRSVVGGGPRVFQLFVLPQPRLRTPPSSDRWTVHPARPASHTHPTGSQGTKAAGRRGPGYQPGSCGLLDRVGQGGGGTEVARSPRMPQTQRKGASGSWRRQKRGRTYPGGGAEGTLGPLGLKCLGSGPFGPNKLSQGRPPGAEVRPPHRRWTGERGSRLPGDGGSGGSGRGWERRRCQRW